MHLAPPSRRALGLAAAGAVLTSSTVFALGGVASAAPSGAVETTNPFGVAYDFDGDTDTWTLPAGYCAVEWHLEGAQGGAGSDQGADGEAGLTLDIVTYVDDPAVATTFTLAPGGSGGSSAGTVGGLGGVSPFTDEYSGYDGYDEDSGGLAGGGGGAASIVIGPDGFFLSASGGYGGGAEDYAGWPGGGYNEVFAITSAPQVDGVGDGGDGSISAVGVLCRPDAPYLNYAEGGDGSLTVDFHQFDDGDVAIAGYEYTTDGGSHWLPLTTTVSGNRILGTFTTKSTGGALSNGATYTVQVRAIGTNGAASEPSQSVEGRPVKKIGAPTGVTVATTPSSLLVRWQPPAGGDTVTGYDVGYGTGEMGDQACVGDATLRSCVIAAQPGADYTVTVYALDANSDAGMPATVHVGVVPAADSAASFPSSVPAKSGDLGGPAGQSSSVTPGSKITLTGSGYLANSTVTLLVYSSPQVLGTVVADANGAFTVTVEIPAGLAAGSHTLVAAGVDAAGNPRYLTMPITVTAAGAAAGSGGLAYTGADVAVPALGGLAALALGGGLVLAGRRKRAAQ
ncbi:fibronectin type III domain-containing protein [Trujillonella humicola]|uniref:fibronectin type III domain-containing protein n=1 Tax=Trujillonella humicola TaxID=3383699 RepID=UPI0039066B47